MSKFADVYIPDYCYEKGFPGLYKKDQVEPENDLSSFNKS